MTQSNLELAANNVVTQYRKYELLLEFCDKVLVSIGRKYIKDREWYEVLSKIRRMLLLQRARAAEAALLFALTEPVQDLAEKKMAEVFGVDGKQKYSVMQYLTPGLVSPLSYYEKDEKEFLEEGRTFILERRKKRDKGGE